jgi:hypothetical protein
MPYHAIMQTPVAIHVRISDDVAAMEALLERLEEELPEKKKNPHGGHGSAKGGHPPLTSWNTQVAMLVMDIHAGVRELETDLRYAIAGTVRVRGGSDGNTTRSLRALPGLCAGSDHAAVQLACKKLEGWIYRAQLILGDVAPFSRLPRLPGQGEPVCPFCNSAGSLRVQHATGKVRCLKPSCRDTEGNKPSGLVEMGQFSAQPLIAWSDGTTGVQASAGAA